MPVDFIALLNQNFVLAIASVAVVLLGTYAFAFVKVSVLIKP
jgi:hypothetical protein